MADRGYAGLHSVLHYFLIVYIPLWTEGFSNNLILSFQ